MNPVQHPITEDDIANFLANTPDFFERHAELLASVQLSSGHGDRAVSLQERQAALLREKIKGLETADGRDDPPRPGQPGDCRQDACAGPASCCRRSRRATCPAPSCRDWPASCRFRRPRSRSGAWMTLTPVKVLRRDVSEDAQTFAASLSAPYCGVNSGFEAAGWLPQAAQAQSLALIPLRAGKDAPGLRPAGAGLARCPALSQRHGHRIPRTPGRDWPARRCRACVRPAPCAASRAA